MSKRPAITIKCLKCAVPFQPDPKTKLKWICPHCNAPNPNLKRHYRGLADLCIIALIVMAIVTPFILSDDDPTSQVILMSADALLLLTAVVVIYASRTPWTNPLAKTLIWIVFTLALLANLVAPLLVKGILNIIFLALYAIIFPYLFWLNSRATRCAPSPPQPTAGDP